MQLGTAAFLSFFVLLVLKLTGVIAGMSWVWITAPLWIAAGVSMIGVALFLLAGFIAYLFTDM